jgi:hypothetical protein
MKAPPPCLDYRKQLKVRRVFFMKEKDKFLKDRIYEGKESTYLDVDRFINEGMAGGNVYQAGNDRQNIEEAPEFTDEPPPQNNQEDL